MKTELHITQACDVNGNPAEAWYVCDLTPTTDLVIIPCNTKIEAEHELGLLRYIQTADKLINGPAFLDATRRLVSATFVA